MLSGGGGDKRFGKVRLGELKGVEARKIPGMRVG